MATAKIERGNGLAVEATLTHATGTAEREAALVMLDRRKPRRQGKRARLARRITLGADKAYDVSGFVTDLRDRNVTPHIAVQGTISTTGKVRKTAIDQRTLRHAGYAISQRIRKRIEEVFGWIKKPGGLVKAKVRGRPKVETVFTFAVIAYNLIRLPKLLEPQTT